MCFMCVQSKCNSGEDVRHPEYFILWCIHSLNSDGRTPRNVRERKPVARTQSAPHRPPGQRKRLKRQTSSEALPTADNEQEIETNQPLISSPKAVSTQNVGETDVPPYGAKNTSFCLCCLKLMVLTHRPHLKIIHLFSEWEHQTSTCTSSLDQGHLQEGAQWNKDWRWEVQLTGQGMSHTRNLDVYDFTVTFPNMSVCPSHTSMLKNCPSFIWGSSRWRSASWIWRSGWKTSSTKARTRMQCCRLKWSSSGTCWLCRKSSSPAQPSGKTVESTLTFNVYCQEKVIRNQLC